MCTVVVLIRPGHAWPLVLAANRDEMLERSWEPPAAHWPDQPDVVAGRDRSGGGTWMGINRAGVVAAVLNRPGSLGPAAGKRSRGDLPLRALAHPMRTPPSRPSPPWTPDNGAASTWCWPTAPARSSSAGWATAGRRPNGSPRGCTW